MTNTNVLGMSCPHLRECAGLTPPSQSQDARLEECTQCFDSQDSPGGVDICLVCFNSGCNGPFQCHAKHHVNKTAHRWTLTVERRPVHSPSTRENTPSVHPPTRMSRLVFVKERQEDKYTFTTTLKCWQCHPLGAPVDNTRYAQEVIRSVMRPIVLASKLDPVEPWRENIVPCEHTLITPPKHKSRIPPFGQDSCPDCGLHDNLWLCLTCGNVGCGRPQLGGLGGNGHALAHYNNTKHPVNVKLGTITPKGGADMYCYECNDATKDPGLAAHLEVFGIQLNKLSKTDKTIAELQDEANIQFDLCLGNVMQPLFGAGRTGLANLEHSSYMASVLQTIFALPVFQSRYFNPADSKYHEEQCTLLLPVQCVECQMRKLADGLLSGRYSHPMRHPSKPRISPTESFQAGISLAGIMALIGKNPVGSAMMRQRDAGEFFTYLLDLLRTDGKHSKTRWKDPTSIFTYTTEQRLLCTKCSCVRYSTDKSDVLSLIVPGIPVYSSFEGQTTYASVALTSCITNFLRAESLEWFCTECKETVRAEKQINFSSLPEVLVVQTEKYVLTESGPAKVPISVELAEGELLLFEDRCSRKSQGDDASVAVSEGPEFDEAIVDQFRNMGITPIHVQKALRATGGLHADEALMWLFEHRDDPGIDDPIPDSPSNKGPEEIVIYDPTVVETLTSFGFTPGQVKKALRETRHNPDQAAEWLFFTSNHMAENEDRDDTADGARTPSASVRFRLLAFISHRGPSMHSGHYIAHIRHGDQWVLFNDERVFKADLESVNVQKKMAYMYFFVRD